jgi:hypothetical protein
MHDKIKKEHILIHYANYHITLERNCVSWKTWQLKSWRLKPEIRGVLQSNWMFPCEQHYATKHRIRKSRKLKIWSLSIKLLYYITIFILISLFEF